MRGRPERNPSRLIMTDRMNLSFLMDQEPAAQPYAQFHFPPYAHTPASNAYIQTQFGLPRAVYPEASVSSASVVFAQQEEIHQLDIDREVARRAEKKVRRQERRVREVEQQLAADHAFAMQLASEHRRSKSSTRSPKRLLPGASQEMSEAQTRAIIKSLNPGTTRMPPMPRRADASATYTPELDPRRWRNDWLQHQRQ